MLKNVYGVEKVVLSMVIGSLINIIIPFKFGLENWTRKFFRF